MSDTFNQSGQSVGVQVNVGAGDMNKPDYQSWLRKYVEAFADEANMSQREAAAMVNDTNITQFDWERGAEPERAGRRSARYALYGEQ